MITKEQVRAHNRRVILWSIWQLVGNIAVVCWILYWLGIL